MIDPNHVGLVCAQEGAGSDHDSQESTRQIAHCCEPDEPGLIASIIGIDYWPVISRLTARGRGALLSGYDGLIYIPPEIGA